MNIFRHSFYECARRVSKSFERFSLLRGLSRESSDQNISQRLMLIANNIQWKDSVGNIAKGNQTQKLFELFLLIWRKGPITIEEVFRFRASATPLLGYFKSSSAKKITYRLQVLSKRKLGRQLKLNRDSNLLRFLTFVMLPIVVILYGNSLALIGVSSKERMQCPKNIGLARVVETRQGTKISAIAKLRVSDGAEVVDIDFGD